MPAFLMRLQENHDYYHHLGVHAGQLQVEHALPQHLHHSHSPQPPAPPPPVAPPVPFLTRPRVHASCRYGTPSPSTSTALGSGSHSWEGIINKQHWPAPARCSTGRSRCCSGRRELPLPPPPPCCAPLAQPCLSNPPCPSPPASSLPPSTVPSGCGAYCTAGNHGVDRRKRASELGAVQLAGRVMLVLGLAPLPPPPLPLPLAFELSLGTASQALLTRPGLTGADADGSVGAGAAGAAGLAGLTTACMTVAGMCTRQHQCVHAHWAASAYACMRAKRQQPSRHGACLSAG